MIFLLFIMAATNKFFTLITVVAAGYFYCHRWSRKTIKSITLECSKPIMQLLFVTLQVFNYHKNRFETFHEKISFVLAYQLDKFYLLAFKERRIKMIAYADSYSDYRKSAVNQWRLAPRGEKSIAPQEKSLP